MLPLRGLIFTLLVPCAIAVYVPRQIIDPPVPQGGPWQAGWLLIVLGSVVYLRCLFRFLAANGTPAIFFTKHLRSILGTEPPVLVRRDLYRFSRNPMYLAVVAVILGQAILYASPLLAVYGAVTFLLFHAVVIWVEEPHLNARDPKSFEDYRRQVPRWLGLPKR